ncbi:MAG: hypothetical protein ACP5N2_01360 [Candidatus Nanoarchaeia archaeon]
MENYPLERTRDALKAKYAEEFDDLVAQKLNPFDLKQTLKKTLNTIISLTNEGLTIAYNEYQKVPWYIPSEEELLNEQKKYDVSNFEFVNPEPKLTREQKNLISQGAHIKRKEQKLKPRTSLNYRADIITHEQMYSYLKHEFAKTAAYKNLQLQK